MLREPFFVHSTPDGPLCLKGLSLPESQDQDHFQGQGQGFERSTILLPLGLGPLGIIEFSAKRRGLADRARGEASPLGVRGVFVGVRSLFVCRVCEESSWLKASGIPDVNPKTG